MKIHKLKLLCAALLSVNLLQSPIEATITNENTTFTDEIMPSVYVATALYIGYNMFTRQDCLVKNRFPHAQAWYDELTKKYPAAHFDQKQFIQKPQQSFLPNFLSKLVENCSWTSNFDHIYFSEESLKEISYVYKKVIDGYPLDEKEQFALARQEFMLLHEAGHIEHNDTNNVMISIVALLASIHGVDFVYNEILKPATKAIESKGENLLIGYEVPLYSKWFLDVEFFSTKVPGILATAQGASFIAGLIAILRYQESQADEFACSLADINTLNGAIAIFENDGTDPLFELENKQLAPFVETNSTLKIIAQTICDPIETIAFSIKKQIELVIKSIPAARWAYDFSCDAVHPSPSNRAQRIKDELARREHNQEN